MTSNHKTIVHMTTQTPLNAFKPSANLLQEKNILITGASQGIGKALAIGCAKIGATVILLGRNEETLASVYDEIETSGYAQPVIVPFDLEDAPESQYQELNKQIQENLGALHGLVHNAGLLGELKPLAQYDAAMFQRLMSVNVVSNFLLTKALMPSLEAANKASVIFTSSSVGRTGRAYWGAYAVSKFAVEGLMQTLAEELRNITNIRCNSINPRATRTAMRAKAYPGEEPESLPTATEIVPAYLYLLSEASSHLNGQQLDAR